eukprot:11168619-Lingulodinium_polyedra.AAC.1
MKNNGNTDARAIGPCTQRDRRRRHMIGWRDVNLAIDATTGQNPKSTELRAAKRHSGQTRHALSNSPGACR